MNNVLTNSQKNSNKYNNIPFFYIAKTLLAAVSVINLIISYKYVSAILKMENEICGFAMFLFILSGLLVLFQSFRMKDTEIIGQIVNIVACIITVLIGMYFASLCNIAIQTQTSLKQPQVVLSSLHVTYFTIGIYVLGMVLLIINIIRDWNK